MSRTQRVVEVPIEQTELEGELVVPDGATGVVLFAHGSGSSRHSPRNNAVAEMLQDEGLATFLFDLLTAEEDLVRDRRFDISLRTGRLAAATQWIDDRAETGDLPNGYFGSSTGAAAALRAAGTGDVDVDAVGSVAAGGRSPRPRRNSGSRATAPTDPADVSKTSA